MNEILTRFAVATALLTFVAGCGAPVGDRDAADEAANDAMARETAASDAGSPIDVGASPDVAASDAWSDTSAAAAAISVRGVYHSIAASGVTCEGTPGCASPQVCCYSITPQCNSERWSATSCYGYLACDGAEDCAAPGTACSVTRANGVYLTATCAATFPGQTRACHDTSECGPSESCCAPSSNAASWQPIGVCHAGSCG